MSKTTKVEKKRIQVQIDKNLANQAEAILQTAGLTETAAIKLFFNRIIQEGKLPFEIGLTPAENARRHLVEVTKDAPVTDLKDAQAVQAWLADEDED